MTLLSQTAKRALREAVLSRVETLSPAVQAQASTAACKRLREQREWQRARSVLLFAPMRGEIDIWPLLEESLAAGKHVALPRYNKRTGTYAACDVRALPTDVCTGHWGIREPANHCPERPLNRLDLVLVPGVAFDLHGRRLGRGKGYYDQLLATVRGLKCGVGFDEQLVDIVPVEPHDILLDCILTPTRWVKLFPGRGFE